MSQPPRLLCVGLDTYALTDVRSAAPDAVLLNANAPEDVLRQLATAPDAIVHGGGPLVDLLREGATRTPTIALVDAMQDATSLPGIVLRRPVDRIVLRRALDRARDTTMVDALRRRLFDPTTSWAPERVFSLLRLSLLIVVIAELLGLTGEVDAVPGAVALGSATLATAHAVARIRWSRMTLPLVVGDAVLWTALAMLPGTEPTAFAVLLVLAIAELGFLRNLRALVWATAIGLAFAAFSAAGPEGTSPVVLLPLVVLACCLGAAVAVVIGNGGRAGRRVLNEVHAALADLHDHAMANPGRLEVGRVRRDAVTLATAELRADRVALVDLGAVGEPILVRTLPDHGGPRPTWADVGAAARALRGVGCTEDPVLLDLVGGGATVLAAPVTAQRVPRGVLLAAWDAPRPGRARRQLAEQLGELATDVAISLENAEMFHAIDELSAKGERARLAGELHDGLVQSFVHVGFELEALARTLADVDLPSALRVVDLRHVVADVVSDTRVAIGHLRDDALDEGLDRAVRRWLQAAPTAGGPSVSYRPEAADSLPPEVLPDLLRVVQEAVGNARQHARAKHVLVTTSVVGDDFVVVVEDDGVGPAGRAEPRHGVGLRSMRERLERLGGHLDVEPVHPHGTRVTARVPGLMRTGSFT